MILQWQSGSPWKLPDKVIYVRDAKLSNIDWSAPVVYGVRPCVAKMDDNGVITLLPKSTNARFGCTLDNYNFLQTPNFAPRFTPDRDGRIRRHTAPQLDVSLNKLTRITEKLGVQFRAEVFNALNKFMYHRQDFEGNPANENFGNIRPAEVGIGSSNFPRQIQLAVKLVW